MWSYGDWKITLGQYICRGTISQVSYKVNLWFKFHKYHIQNSKYSKQELWLETPVNYALVYIKLYI